MNLIAFLLALALFLALIGLMQPFASRVRLALTVVLAVVGIVIGAAALFLLATPLTNAFNEVAIQVLSLPIGSEVFFYVFLPTLLFQTALTIEVRRMLEDWVPILVMAVLAVFVATFVIGFALAPFGVQPLAVCLVVAAIVATTDPSAVVGIFRDISAPARLGRLIEGESLMNDAAAITLFSVFLATVVTAVPITSNEIVGAFLVNLLGGIAFGYVAMRLGIYLITVVRDDRLATMSVSLAVPYIIFIVAEQFLGVSGVIAVVFAGLTLNLMGPSRLPPESWDYLTTSWEQLAFWAGTLIFVLAAILVPRLLDGITLPEVSLIGVVIVAALLARAIVLFGVLPLLRLARLSPSVSTPYKLVIMWGGLRGSVTLALALAVTENPLVAPDVQRFVAVLATGFVLFTLLVQGTTLRPVIRWLGLDRLSPLDVALSKQVIAVALQNVREEIAEAVKGYGFPREVARSEAKTFGTRLEEAVREADEVKIRDRDRITLGLVTLAARERDIILEKFRERLITQSIIDRMLSEAERLVDRTRTGGRIEYLRAANAALAFSFSFRAAQQIQRRLGYSGPLEARIADRFDRLLHAQIILNELDTFTNRRILRIHGRRVADLIHEILERRREEVEQALDALRLQYPGYSERLERSFIRKLALRQEELEYDTLESDRLIGPELHRSLRRDLAAARAREDVRPALDAPLPNREILRNAKLFRDLDDDALDALAEALVAHYASPGEVLVRDGDVSDTVYLIASGAVEIESAGQTFRLGRGDIFGELGMLGRRRRRAEVTAISYATLLCLEQTRFLALLDRNPSLRTYVEGMVAVRAAPTGPSEQRPAESA